MERARKSNPWFGILMAAALLCGGGAVGRAQPMESTELCALDLHASFMQSSFSGVNQTDAQAAFKVFAIRMGEQRGYAITPYVHIFEDTDAMKKYIKDHPIDLAILDTWDYLTMQPMTNLPATFAAIEQGRVEERCLVLVPADSPMVGLSDLVDKHVLVLRSSNASIVHHWFRTEILSLGHGPLEKFCGRLEIKEQLAQVVLPVFFGKADACVLDRRGFDIMVEMNPQVGNRLRVLAQSEPYLDTLCCVRLGNWDHSSQRQDLMEAMLDLPNDPAGNQIMSLFKFNGVAPFEKRFLDNMRTLRSRYNQQVAAPLP